MADRHVADAEPSEPDGDDTLDEDETAATVTDVVHALDDDAEEAASGDREQEAGET